MVIIKTIIDWSIEQWTNNYNDNNNSTTFKMYMYQSIYMNARVIKDIFDKNERRCRDVKTLNRVGTVLGQEVNVGFMQ